VLRNFFRDRTDVYISGNNLIYYEEGNPKKCVSPDGYVVFGVPMRQRDCYKVWKEGGKLPSVVIEYTSRKTRKEDRTTKYHLYQNVLCVPEYFLFDPKGDYLKPRLQGYRLAAGKYEPMLLIDDRLYSEQLDLYLVLVENTMRFLNPANGQVLRTLAEETQALAAEARRAAAEAQRAESERQRADAAEQEIARLQAELAAMKSRHHK